MPDVDVKKLLSPTGAEIQAAVQGTRNAGRVAVAVYWDEIDNALKSGVPVAAIYRVLHKAGLVKVTRQAFTRQVKARREGLGNSDAPASPGADEARGFQEPEALTTAGPLGSAPAPKPPADPHRPWRTGPRKAPDPNAVFRPRDPLADD